MYIKISIIRGGFALIYLAIDLQTNKKVAVKQIPKSNNSDS